MSLVLAMGFATVTLCAQTAPELPKKNVFGGKAVSDANFTAGAGDFTLELAGASGVEIRFTTANAKVVSYTPSASGTVRFVRKNAQVHVYENGAYVGTATEADVTLPTVDDATVASTTDQLLTNPQFHTETEPAADLIPTALYQWESDELNLDRVSFWKSGIGDNYLLRLFSPVGNEAWTANEHYVSQKLNNIKPNTLYVFRFSQLWFGSADGETTIDVHPGLGSAAGTIDYASSDLTIGRDKNGVSQTLLYTSDNFAQGADVYFSFRTVSSSTAFESEIDWMSLQEVNANSAFGTARYLDGKTYAPAEVVGTDVTSYITNPSFEDGTNGWALTYGTTGWTDCGDRDFATDFMDGTHVLNMWTSQTANLPYKAEQTITLPAGTYMLTARLTSNKNSSVGLFADNVTSYFKMDNDGSILQENSIVFNVATDGTSVNIGVLTDDLWFKADYFQLRLLSDAEVSQVLTPYHFVATDWVSGDEARVLQSNISYDDANNTITVNATGNNNVCLNLATLTKYYIDNNKRYFVVSGTNLATDLTSSYFWWFNGGLEGDHPAITRVNDKNRSYIIWDADATVGNRSVYGRIGEVNTNMLTGMTILNSDEGMFNTDFGLTSTTGTSVIDDINFYNNLSQVDGLNKAVAYTRLAKLVAAAGNVNANISRSAFNESVVSNLNTAISNAQAALDAEDDGSKADTYYFDAIDALQTAVNTALYQAGVPMDVTDLYLANPSFADGYSEPWAIADGNQFDSKLYKTGDPHVAANTDADGIMYNLYGEADVAGQMIQNTAFDVAKGKYKLTAYMTSDTGRELKLQLGANQTAFTEAGDAGVLSNKESDVLDLSAAGQTLSVGAVSDNAWFKADNFHLLYLPIADKSELKNVYKTAVNVRTATGANAALETAITNAWAAITDYDRTEAQVADVLAALRSALQASYTEVSVPATSIGTAPADGEFFLYNFQTKTYMSFGDVWGTRAIAGDYRGNSGTLLTLAQYAGSTNRYTINTGAIYDNKYLFASDDNGVWVDGNAEVSDWAAMPWTFTEVPGLEGKNIFRLQRADHDKNATDGYLRLGSYDGANYYPQDLCCTQQNAWDNELESYWILVSKQMRVDSLALATPANPIDASFYILNPDLEGQGRQNNSDPRNWTHVSMTHAQSGEGGAWGVDRSMESYELSVPFDLNQTVTGLKPGLYMVKTFGFYHHGPIRGFGGDHAVTAATDHHRGRQRLPVIYAQDAAAATPNATPILSAYRDGKAYEAYCEAQGIEPVGAHIYWSQYNGLFDREDLFWDYGWVPNHSATVHQQFVPGFWNDNAVLVNVSDQGAGTGSLTIGVKKDFTQERDMALFDHFQLFYLGAANADYVTAYNAYRNQRMDTRKICDDDFDYASQRDVDYVAGGTKVYQNALKAALATADAAFASANASMTSADASTLAAATEELRKATEKCRLQFVLAEFNDFYNCCVTLANQDAHAPAGVTVAEHSAAKSAYQAKVNLATNTKQAAESNITVGATADQYIFYAEQIRNLDATLHTDVEAYIAKADPMDNNVFDLTAMLKRPDMTGIECWADPEIYGWLSDQPGFSHDADPFRNFNIHTLNNLYKGEVAYFAECYVEPRVDLSQGWSIYQKFHLPAGDYRFTAASFASDGNEGQTKPSSNGYLAVGNSTATNIQRSQIPTGFLSDNTVTFTVSDAMGASADSLNLGIYMTDEGTKANWVGLGYMHLYKIPAISIRENLTYMPYRNQETAESMPNYHDVFNFTDQAKLAAYRNFPKQTGRWATLCLPCNMTADQVREAFGPNVLVNWFSKYSIELFDDDARSNPTDGDFGAIVNLTFEDPTDENAGCHHTYAEEPYLIVANMPVLIMINDADYLQTNRRNELGDVDLGEGNKNIGWYDLGSAIPEHIQSTDAARFNPADFDSSIDTSNGVFHFVGVYDGTGDTDILSDPAATTPDEGGFIIPQPTAEKASYYLSNTSNVAGDDSYLPESHFRYVGTGVTQRMRGLRGYFEYSGPSSAIKAGRISLSINGGQTTAISDVKVQAAGSQREGIYNLQGQRVANSSDSLNNLPKGVYVVNGKKVIVK